MRASRRPARRQAPPRPCSFSLAAPEAILDLDPLHLARRPEAGPGPPRRHPRIVVCTHGKMAPCCAIRGHAVFRAPRAATTHELWPRGFRGRIGQPPPEAAAETLLRRRHEAWGATAVLLQQLTATGGERWRVEADVHGEHCEDRLERLPDAGYFRPLCRAEAPAAVPARRLGSR